MSIIRPASLSLTLAVALGAAAVVLGGKQQQAA